MKPKPHFKDEYHCDHPQGRILGVRAGQELDHRVIGIWVVVVDGRVFVRSWSMKPRSWWRTFLEDPYGEIIVCTATIHHQMGRRVR